jgi:hypothetical protein
MELKNVDPSSDNVIGSNVNNINFIFILLKIVKIEFKKKHHMFFFLQDVVIACKTKFLILFTSHILINIQ